MFRKIVSNLPFSPALVGQLGFYAKRLRKEETTRRLGLIFVVLALIVQSLAVFQPPESANAASLTDMNSRGFGLDTSNVCSDSINNSLCIGPNIIKIITATNASQGFVDALSVTAYAGDQISYTITIENTGLSSTSTKLEDHLADTLEYATLADGGGGTLDKKTGTLSWPDVTLDPNTKQTRTFVIRLLDTIPATAQGVNYAKSYDCIISNTFGNSIDVRVDCPTPKIIERTVAELPKVGPTENIIFASIVLTFTAYFYARTRQLKNEIRLIRRDTNAGTI